MEVYLAEQTLCRSTDRDRLHSSVTSVAMLFLFAAS